MQEPEEKKIALELLETEQAYVNRLHLLDQVSWGVEVPVQEDFGESEAVKMRDMWATSLYRQRLGLAFAFPTPHTSGKHPCPSKAFHSPLLLEPGISLVCSQAFHCVMCQSQRGNGILKYLPGPFYSPFFLTGIL